MDRNSEPCPNCGGYGQTRWRYGILTNKLSTCTKCDGTGWAYGHRWSSADRGCLVLLAFIMILLMLSVLRLSSTELSTYPATRWLNICVLGPLGLFSFAWCLECTLSIPFWLWRLFHKRSYYSWLLHRRRIFDMLVAGSLLEFTFGAPERAVRYLARHSAVDTADLLIERMEPSEANHTPLAKYIVLGAIEASETISPDQLTSAGPTLFGDSEPLRREDLDAVIAWLREGGHLDIEISPPIYHETHSGAAYPEFDEHWWVTDRKGTVRLTHKSAAVA